MNRRSVISTTCLKSIKLLKAADSKNIKNAWDINNGSCYDFADLVCKTLSNQNNIGGILQIDNVLIEKYYFKELSTKPSDDICYVLSNIISSLKNHLDSYNKSLHIADFIIELQPHVWLYDSTTKLFFDAELPFGSLQITDLPYISRNVWGNVIDNSDYYADKPNDVRGYLIEFVSKMILDDIGNHHKLMSITELVNDCNYLCKGLKADANMIISESIKNNNRINNCFNYDRS